MMTGPAAEDDKDSLRMALRKVSRAYPEAVAVRLATDGVHGHGFILTEVVMWDGQLLSHLYGSEAITRLDDEISDDLQDLAWAGVLKEDKHGFAEVPIPDDFPWG
jgi:hypothetical protein